MSPEQLAEFVAYLDALPEEYTAEYTNTAAYLDGKACQLLVMLGTRDAEVARLRGALTEIALYLSLRRSPGRDPLVAEEFCAVAERIAKGFV